LERRVAKLERLVADRVRRAAEAAQAAEAARRAEGGPLDRLLRLIREAHGNLPNPIAGNQRAFLYKYYTVRQLASELPDEDPERPGVVAALCEYEEELRDWFWTSQGSPRRLRELELVAMGALEFDDVEGKDTDDWKRHENWYLRGEGRGWLEKFARQRPAVERCLAEIFGSSAAVTDTETAENPNQQQTPDASQRGQLCSTNSSSVRQNARLRPPENPGSDADRAT